MSQLKDLRKAMSNRGVEAYLIPRTDEFQSEYTAPYAERLKFLTGFSGSAGLAIVTPKSAAFFTDGRYTLQAEQQLDGKEFGIFNVADQKPQTWLAENIKGKIGYDPWLFTEIQMNCYKEAGLDLQPIPENLIDPLWGQDQPNRPIDHVFLHPLQYAGQEFTEKCQVLADRLKKDKVDKVLITNPDSLSWLLNIRGDDVPYTPVVLGYAILNQDASFDLFMSLTKANGRLYTTLSNHGRIIEINNIGDHLNKKALHGTKVVQLDSTSTPAALVEMLEASGVSIQRKEDPCQLLKALKNEVEIEGARQAHIRDGVALTHFFNWLSHKKLKGETTEFTAAEKLYEFRKEGDRFYDLSFTTISGYGRNGAIIHYAVEEETALPIGEDSLYLLDSGAQYYDGTTDVTRTICLGTPTDEQKKRFTQVLKGHIGLSSIRFPQGTSGAQLDALARQALWQDGLDYDHGTGHGVGSFLGVHEGPQGISKLSRNIPLQPGMILSNEPGYYKEGEYGIRIESLVLVKECTEASHTRPFYEFETLTMVPIDRNLIDPSLLSHDELAWLNDYHAKVFETLSPLLNGPTRAWLKTATEEF